MILGRRWSPCLELAEALRYQWVIARRICILLKLKFIDLNTITWSKFSRIFP